MRRLEFDGQAARLFIQSVKGHDHKGYLEESRGAHAQQDSFHSAATTC